MAQRILVVDDEADLVDILTARLAHKGYAIADAQSGFEALGMYIAAANQNEPYDLILLDIRLPGPSGLDILSHIRQEEKIRGINPKKRIPIIIITALPQQDKEAYDRGCDDFVQKPVDFTELEAKIKEKLGS